MTDFYTVLRSAIERVGATESAQRERVYDHVREVMVRKLRNHRPPVGETEIASRVTTFEAAVERIESEIFEEEEALARTRAPQRENAFEEAVADGGYADGRADDDRFDYADRDGAGYRDEPYDPPDEYEDEAQAPDPIWDTPAIDMAWDESSEQWRDARLHGGAAYGETRGNGYDRDVDREDDRHARRGRRSFWSRRTRVEPEETDEPAGHASWDEPPSEPERAPVEARSSAGWFGRFRKRRRDPYSELEEQEGLEDDSPRSRRKRRRKDRDEKGRRGRGRAAARGNTRRVEEEDDPIAALASRISDASGRAREEPLLLSAPSARQTNLYLPSPDRATAMPEAEAPAEFDDFEEGGRTGRRQKRRSKREARRAAAVEPLRPRRQRRGRIWALVVFVLAVGAVAWAASVFLPLLSSDEGGETAQAEAPIPAAPPQAAVANPPTPAAPTLNAAAGDIVLFQGGDPTVFEAGADNPINYQGDASGGFVRISSTINSGGARAIIGPGVAERLAGHQVRVVIEARGTPGQPAPAVRLAYRQGLLILDWRLSRLINDFAIITATWTVPERTGNNTDPDYLMIEPGVAGDGTAVDIRSIRFEILD